MADRSKSDVFTKTFAIAQSSWLIVSSIARAHSGLAISELELATIAFIICAIAMYSFWWSKPFGAEQRCLTVAIFPSQESVRTWMQSITNRPATRHLSLNAPNSYRHVLDLSWDEFTWLTVNHRFAWSRDNGTEWASVSLYITGITFSAVHLAAWNWDFPSPTVQVLWRAASLGALLASACPFFLAPLIHFLEKMIGRLNGESIFVSHFNFLGQWIRSRRGHLFWLLTMATLFVYVACRFIILVLVFYCFSFMPVSVYEELEWARYIPHYS